MTRIRVLLFAAWICAFVAATQGQTGTASLSGVVISSDASQPVRRAIVTLTGTAIATNVSAVTDDQGRFAFSGLTPGRYFVSASKPAYITTIYGASRPGRPGTAVAVSAGQRLDLRLSLAHGAVITGMVRDTTGTPAADVQVIVRSVSRTIGTTGASSPTDTLVTDDRGIYRAFGLTPGEYLVAALPTLETVTNITRAAAGDIDALFRTLTPAAGARATATTAMPDRLADATFAYAPVFYPGTAFAARAATVSVAPGAERSGIDITLDLVKSARVEGVFASPDGLPIGSVRATLLTVGPALPVSTAPAVATVGAGGAFTFRNVPPGHYVLFAHTDATGGRSDAPSSAFQEVTVDGQDVVGLAVTMTSALSVSGRVVFDRATLAPPSPLTGIRVGLARSESGDAAVDFTPSGMAPDTSVTAAADGTFSLPDVLPGRYLLSGVVPGANGPAGWWLRSAMLGNRDLLDMPLEISATSTSISGVVLTFSDRHAELAGLLQTASAQPASEFTVIVYPADRALWQPDARRIRSVRPADDGRFSVIDLPAGEYRVAALTDVAPDEWRDAAFLETLSAASVTFRIADGERVTQTLRISE